MPSRGRRGWAASDAERVRRRRTHLGRLLFELSASFERESLARLHRRGHTRLTQAHKQVIIHLPLAGARLTELAARMRISKQAAMKLVDGLESLGYVRREDDRDDQRAKVVLLTARGRRLIDDGLDVVGEMEAEFGALVGASRLERLRDDLIGLSGALRLEMPDDPAGGRSTAQ